MKHLEDASEESFTASREGSDDVLAMQTHPGRIFQRSRVSFGSFQYEQKDRIEQ